MALVVGGTSLLLHGNGTDGSTAFPDETGKTVTAYGSARISTAQSKFGGSSMYFDGAGDYLTVPASDDFVFGTGDFTVEAWVYWLGSAGYTTVVGLGASTAGPNFYIYNGAAYWYLAARFGHQTQLTAYVWTHVVCQRRSGMISLYVNGVVCTTPAMDAGNINPPTLTIGAATTGAQEPFNGYISELRVVKGVAIYLGDFTPPATPLSIVPPIQIQIQAQDVGLAKLAKYDPSQTKPVMQAVVDDLQDRMPYGLWQTPAVVSEFKGRGVISGTVKVFGSPDNVPLGRLVRLHREPDGMFVRATWSDPITGAYTFNGVRPDCKYSVTSFDYQHGYRAVIADNLSATPL